MKRHQHTDVMMDQLFDDSRFIEKRDYTSNEKRKWKRKFQEYCNSQEIQEESARTGLNACGCWFACDECREDYSNYPCSSSLISYLKKKRVSVDYGNTDKEYLDKLLRLKE